MELNQPFSLSAVFRAVTAAAEDEDHGMLSLQFGELPAFRDVVGKLAAGVGLVRFNAGSGSGIRRAVTANQDVATRLSVSRSITTPSSGRLRMTVMFAAVSAPIRTRNPSTARAGSVPRGATGASLESGLSVKSNSSL